RVVANDYTIRFRNRFYRLLKPVYPGERGGKVVIELRLDGTMAIRYRTHYLNYQEVTAGGEALGGSAPQTPPQNNLGELQTAVPGLEHQASWQRSLNREGYNFGDPVAAERKARLAWYFLLPWEFQHRPRLLYSTSQGFFLQQPE